LHVGINSKFFFRREKEMTFLKTVVSFLFGEIPVVAGPRISLNFKISCRSRPCRLRHCPSLPERAMVSQFCSMPWPSHPTVSRRERRARALPHRRARLRAPAPAAGPGCGPQASDSQAPSLPQFVRYTGHLKCHSPVRDTGHRQRQLKQTDRKTA
jgi:hypothetical protein